LILGSELGIEAVHPGVIESGEIILIELGTRVEIFKRTERHRAETHVVVCHGADVDVFDRSDPDWRGESEKK
jgi:hypothetical protein